MGSWGLAPRPLLNLPCASQDCEARLDGPSLAQQGFRGVHAAQPHNPCDARPRKRRDRSRARWRAPVSRLCRELLILSPLRGRASQPYRGRSAMDGAESGARQDVDRRDPDRARSAGYQAAGLATQPGCVFFWLLFFAHTKKSDAVWLQAKIYPARVAQMNGGQGAKPQYSCALAQINIGRGRSPNQEISLNASRVRFSGSPFSAMTTLSSIRMPP